ncbi:MAG TPA: hypothetical protein VEI97_21005, partial [bacterium]|nr:hypothetical protein [bacterium]
GGLLILNITAGRTPVILNHLRTNHAWGPIAVQGGRLYAVRDGTQVAVLDVTKSTSPDVLQVQEVGAAITALAVDGDRLLVGLRGAPPYGALRTYRIDGDGSLRWTGSRLLPGPPTAFAPREGPQAGLVAWGSESGEAGIEAVRPESDAAITIVGPLDVPPAPGPWLAQGTRFWTSTSNAVTIRDASHPGFPEVASSRFADQGSGIALQGLDLHTVNGSALAVLGRRWVHLQPRPDGAIATDPWPLGATEEVLAAGGDQVLVWERDALRYAVHRLQPGGSPVQVTEWVGTYPQGGGPWEVAGGAVDPGGDRFATAEQFAGATLFEAGQVVQRVDGLRATAVAIGPNRRWAAAGDRTIPGEPVQAEVHFLSPDAPA